MLEPGTGERIALHFGWPAGLRIEVATFWERSRRRGELAREHRGHSRHEIRTERAAGGALRIRTLHDPPADDGGPVETRLDARVSSLMPDYVVGGEGDFLGIVDVERLRDDLRLFLRDLFPGGPQGVDGDALVDGLTREDLLESAAAGEWNWLVGAWAGGDLEIGAVYAYDEPGTLAALGGAAVRTHHRFTLLGRTSCRDDGRGAECVELAIRSEADPVDIERAIDHATAPGAGPPVRGRQGGAPDHEVIEELSVLTEVRLITEPHTLLPHRFEQTRATQGRALAGGAPVEFEQREQKIVHYRYPAAPRR